MKTFSPLLLTIDQRAEENKLFAQMEADKYLNFFNNQINLTATMFFENYAYTQAKKLFLAKGIDALFEAIEGAGKNASSGQKMFFSDMETELKNL